MNIQRRLINKRESIFLIVDIQKVMFDLCLEKIVVEKNIDALVQFASTFSIPVIFTEHNSSKLGGFEPSLLKKSPNSPVFNKVEFGCLGNKKIREAIRKSGKNTIVLAGIESHVCIFQTAVQALEAGYGVHVVTDAVSARSKSNMETGLGRMRQAGAVMSSVEMLIFEMLAEAGTDNFRKALPIIKKL